MSLSLGISKAVAPRRQMHPYQVASGDKVYITALVCASVAGLSLNPQLTAGKVPATVYGVSDSGWMDANLFNEWFCNHFFEVCTIM